MYKKSKIKKEGLQCSFNFSTNHGGIDMSSQYQCVVLGDWHFQSPYSQPQVVGGMMDFIQKNRCKTIHLNGDIMDGLRLNDREKFVWQRFIDMSYQINISLAPGNHDADYRSSAFEMGAIKIVEDLMLEIGGKKFYIAHGHQCDDTLHHESEWWVRYLIRLDLLAKNFEWFYHKYVYNSSIWKERSEKIAQAGLKLVNEKGVDGVIFSHSHKPLCRPDGYYNTGNACEGCASSPRKNTMLTIDCRGKVEIQKFSVYGEYLGVLDLAA